MSARNKIIRTYSVIICIIAVITFLIAGSNLVSSLIDKGNPTHSGQYKENLTSFENFKMESMKSISKEQAYIPGDEDLRKMFESAKEENQQMVNHRISKTITVSSIFLVVSVVLFFFHWRLLKNLSE